MKRKGKLKSRHLNSYIIHKGIYLTDRLIINLEDSTFWIYPFVRYNGRNIGTGLRHIKRNKRIRTDN